MSRGLTWFGAEVACPVFPDRNSLTALYHFSHRLSQNALQKVFIIVKSFGIIISRLQMFENNIFFSSD